MVREEAVTRSATTLADEMTYFLQMAFDNSGTVEVQTGTLYWSGGGTSTGTADISSGAILRLAGTHALSGNLSGDGTVRVSGGTATFAGTPVSNTLTLRTSGGTAAFATGVTGPFAQLTQNGRLADDHLQQVVVQLVV